VPKAKLTPIGDTRKIFITDNARYDIPLGFFGPLEFSLSKFLTNPRSFKAAVLTGGEDIYPGLYGHHIHRDCGRPNIQRDQRDLLVARTAMAWRVPLVGICRGAQLLNALAGGWLVQDCDNHTRWHDIRTSDKRLIHVSSTHHQMMVPPRNSSGELLAWAEPRLSTFYKGGKKCGYIKHSLIPREVDCIFFPRISALAMQFHPEYMKEDAPAFEYALQLIRDKLGLPIVKGKFQAPFISLPKDDPGSVKSEPLTPVQEARAWREQYLASRFRQYRASLHTTEEALDHAANDLEDLLKNLTEEELARLEPTRAAGASE